MNLTIEDLKLIRMGLNKVPVSQQLWDTIKNVDAMLAEHNLKYEMVPFSIIYLISSSYGSSR